MSWHMRAVLFAPSEDAEAICAQFPGRDDRPAEDQPALAPMISEHNWHVMGLDGEVYGGTFNHVLPDALIAHLSAIKWRWPERVVLVYYAEGADEAHTWRPAPDGRGQEKRNG